MRIALPNRITLSTNVNRKYLNIMECTHLSRSLFVTLTTVDNRQQTQAFLDSALRMRAVGVISIFDNVKNLHKIANQILFG